MSDNVIAALQQLEAGNKVGFQDHIQAELHARINDKIDAIKVDTAKQLFAQPEAEVEADEEE